MRSTLDAFLSPTEEPSETNALARDGREATRPNDLDPAGERKALANDVERSAARHPTEGRE